MKGLEQMACLSCFRMLACSIQLGEGGRIVTGIPNAVKVGLSLSTTYTEVHVAIWTYIDIGKGEGTINIGQKGTSFSAVGRTFRG